MTVNISVNDDRLLVSSPYNEAFRKAARDLNARWDGNTWSFDRRDERRVRDLCLRLYGTDGATQAATVTLRVRLGNTCAGAADLGGRPLAYRATRDESVTVGDGVVVIEGGFPRSGGSRASPALSPRPGTVLEVRDFPLPLARDLLAGDIKTPYQVEVVGEAEPPKPSAVREAFRTWCDSLGWDVRQVLAVLQDRATIVVPVQQKDK
jgi:hypothetical protein